MRRTLLPLVCVFAACAPSRPSAELPVYTVDVAHPSAAARLLEGFETIHGSWRFTAPSFSVTLDTPPDRPLFLALEGSAPRELLTSGPATLSARVNGRPAGSLALSQPGLFVFSQPLDPALLNEPSARVEFSLDRSFEDPETHRPFALVAVSISLTNIDPAHKEELRQATRDTYEQNRLRRAVPLDADQDRALMSLYHHTPVWRSFWFHSIRIEKSPTDLWNMQQLISELRPDFIVETGTFRGGSALFWANALNGLGLTRSRVLTVDVSDFTSEAALDPLWPRYIEFFRGSSTDPAIVDQLRRRTHGARVLVTLDSDHAAHHVLRELRMYAPLVSQGSYLIVEDTEMDGVPTYPESFPGPLAAVTLFLKEGGAAQFESDATRERLGITYNPAGWLRRK